MKILSAFRENFLTEVRYEREVGDGFPHTYKEMAGAAMKALIEFLVEGGGADYRGLNDTELREIGEFTRENILRWRPIADSFSGETEGIKDFHAVCGDIEIPWSTEEAKQIYETIMEAHRVRKEAALTKIREMNRATSREELERLLEKLEKKR